MELNNQYGNYSNPEGQNQISQEEKQRDPRYKFYMKYAQGYHLDGTPFEETPQASKKNSQAQKTLLNRYNSADNLFTVNQQPKTTTNQKAQINNVQKYSNDSYREQLFYKYSKTNQTNTVVEKQITTTRTVPQVNHYNQTIERSISPQINRPTSMNYQQIPYQNINYTNSQFTNQNSLQRVRSNPDLLSSRPLSSGYKIEQKKLVNYDKKRQQNKDNYKYNLFSVLDQPWNGCLGSDTGKCAGNECFASDGQRGEGWK